MAAGLPDELPVSSDDEVSQLGPSSPAELSLDSSSEVDAGAAGAEGGADLAGGGPQQQLDGVGGGPLEEDPSAAEARASDDVEADRQRATAVEGGARRKRGRPKKSAKGLDVEWAAVPAPESLVVALQHAPLPVAERTLVLSARPAPGPARLT